MIQTNTLEAVKADFSIEEFLKTRDLTFQGLELISKSIQPGMLENDATQTAHQILKDLGAEKFWHRTYIRFGTHTLKAYSDPAGPNIQLKENDIYFVDIGPVFHGYEGDAGATFVVGHDSEMEKCRDDSKRIFDEVRNYWKETRATGIDLYQFAEKKASDSGWQLNMKAGGHRLSEFPHQVYSKTALSKVSFSPSPHIWVLEIQIRHKTRDFGAFYEDLIY